MWFAISIGNHTWKNNWTGIGLTKSTLIRLHEAGEIPSGDVTKFYKAARGFLLRSTECTEEATSQWPPAATCWVCGLQAETKLPCGWCALLCPKVNYWTLIFTLPLLHLKINGDFDRLYKQLRWVKKYSLLRYYIGRLCYCKGLFISIWIENWLLFYVCFYLKNSII